MSNSRENLNKILAIKNAIDEDRLVIFAGSGISVESGLPLWADLVKGMKESLSFVPEKLDDALKVAQILYNEKGEKEYYDIVNNLIYKNSINKPNLLHEIIFSLNPQHIVTTNYDTFLEEVIANKGLDYSLVAKDEDLPYGKFKNLLIKYHGDFQNHNIVLKETDYLEFSLNNPLKEIFVKSLFSNKVVLFVGYSFSDINLKILNQEIRHILKKHHQRTYLISISEPLSLSEIKYYENNGVNIIEFEKLKEELPEFSSIVTVNSSKLSEHSNRLYSILSLISNYNPDSYKKWLTPEHTGKLIDEIYAFFSDFYYFRKIPSIILSHNSIFNYQDNPSVRTNIFHGNVFTCQNNLLYELFRDYDPKDKKNLSESQMNKMEYIVNRFLFSDIHTVVLPKKGSDSFGYSASDHKTSVDLTVKRINKEKCDCIMCSISNYNYDVALQKTENYQFSENSELFEDLTYAFGCYQLDNYYLSFLGFKQILSKANRLKRFEVSFLAKYNLYRLSKLSYLAYYSHLEYDEIKNMLDEYKDFDLDKEFYKTKQFVNKDLYEFLRELKNGIFIQNLCDDIDDKYNKIPLTKKLIEKGGSSSNSDVSNLFRSCVELERFLNLNFIIGNGFSRINLAFRKSINAFFTAYAISLLDSKDDDFSFFGNPGLQKFNHYILKLIVDYSKPEDLHKILTELSLKDIKIGDDDRKNFMEMTRNFFASSYKVNTVFGNDFYGNTLFKGKLISDGDFRKSVEIKIKNIYLIFSYFDFEESELNEMMELNNRFIQFTDFRFKRETWYLEKILSLKGEQIETKALETLLDLLSKRKDYCFQYLLTLHILKQRDESYVTNSFESEYFDIENNVQNIAGLYSALTEDEKRSLIMKVEKHFGLDNVDIDDYFYIIDNKIPLKSEFRKKYIDSISARIKDQKNKDVSRGKVNFFLNFIYLVYQGKITKKEAKMMITEKPYFSFLLSPKDFPEKEFDISWLKLETSPEFISAYKKATFILPTLEKYLQNNFDKEFAEIYFKLKV